MHDPAPLKCTVVPLAVQLPVAEKATGRPELADAETAKSGSPNVRGGSAAKLIVWLALSVASVWTPPAAINFTPVTPFGVVHWP